MAITIYTKPDQYAAGYSYLPLRIKSDNVDTFENFKYTVNIVYNKVEVQSGEPYAINGQMYTYIKFTTDHKFTTGDAIIMNTPTYKGIFNIMAIPSNDTIVIDLVLGEPFDTYGSVGLVVPYLFSPNFSGEVELDLSSTLKDFVTQNLEDVNEIYSGHDTRFKYDIVLGEQSQYVFEFDDNHFDSGVAGFVKWDLVAADIPNLPFQIGDQINIQQDLVRWEFDDNQFNSGHVGFTSTNKHSFRVGQELNISGAIINNYYNGPTRVLEVIDEYNLVTEKTWGSNTSPEAGFAFGIPRPEYNTVATITDIYFAPGYGVVIKTDIPYAGGTVAIGGKITFADERITTNLFEEEVINNYIFNARTETIGFDITEFDQFVLQMRNPLLNAISTIYDNVEEYRIERSTKSWLLIHRGSDKEDGAANGVTFTWKDKLGNTIGKSFITTNNNFLDFYVPVGIDQVLQSSFRTDTVTLNTIVDNISSYNITASYSMTSVNSRPIKFELNDDCSKYEIYHLMWKDRRGSWLSYPFKYVNRQSSEFEHKTYYQKTGNFDRTNNTFGYNSFDRGETSYFNRSRDKMILNSGWVDEFENVLIKDLLLSGSVYVQQPDGKLIGCNINNKELEFGQDINDPIYNYTFEIRVSMNDYRF